MATLSEQALPFDAARFREIKAKLTRPYQWETVEDGNEFHILIRVPAPRPDPIAHLGRAVEEFPAWLEGKLGTVWLTGTEQSMRVPGFQASPLLRERLDFDKRQATDLRARLTDAYVAFLYRAKGDPLRLVRLALRIPKPRVSALDESDLESIAFACAEWVDRRRDHLIQAIVLVADEDHLRLGPHDFFSDIKQRLQSGRPRAPDRATAKDPEPDAFSLFDAPPEPETPDRLLPITSPTRRVEDVTALVELDAMADAGSAATAPAKPGVHGGLAQSMKVARWLLDLHGYRFEHLAKPDHEATHSLLAYRADAPPRRVLVRAFAALDRRTARVVRAQVSRMDVDHVVLVLATAPPRSIRRLASQNIQILAPHELRSLQF